MNNEEIRNKIKDAIWNHKDLLINVRKRKLLLYGHTCISRASGMARTIMQGTVKGRRSRGRQRKRLENNIKDWSLVEDGVWGIRIVKKA